MKALFAKFMGMPVSVRVSAVFISVVLSMIVFMLAVKALNQPVLLIGMLFGVSIIRLAIYLDTGK